MVMGRTFFKTRTQASDAVDNGKVRIDRDRIKPARTVRAGEIVQIDNGATEWEVEVRALSDKRGSAAIAQTLYAETEQSQQKRQQQAEQRKLFHEPSFAIKGRPAVCWINHVNCHASDTTGLPRCDSIQPDILIIRSAWRRHHGSIHCTVARHAVCVA
jgi:ribosome-associated heat shock protein Hsp15